jgi:hypothetical protein
MKQINKGTVTALFAAALCLGLTTSAEAGAGSRKAGGKSKSSKSAKAPSKSGKGSKKSAGEANDARKKAKNYDFTADEIDGDRVRPDGTTIFGVQSTRHASLIRLRQHFIPEIVKSAEWL